MLILVSSSGGGGSVPSGTLNGNVANVAIPDGAASVSVVFALAFPDTTYSINALVRNTVDGSPLNLIITETAKSTTGATFTFNAPADSANYILEYIAARTL